MMVLCRSFVQFNSPFQRSTTATHLFHNCPPRLPKFTPLPLSSPPPLSSLSSSSMDTPPQGYRRNVGICLVNPSKKIFAASRLDIPDAWQMPQTNNVNSEFAHIIEFVDGYYSAFRKGFSVLGGIDESEDPRNAAIRELREETGVTSVDIVAEAPYWLTYDFPPGVRAKLKQQWGSDWKGQAQKWFLLKFNGKDEEVNLLGDGTEKPEFGQWSWMSPQEIVDHSVDFKKPVYEQVMKAFSPYLE